MTFEEFQKKKREGTLIQNKSSMSFEEFKQRKTDGTLLNKTEEPKEITQTKVPKEITQTEVQKGIEQLNSPIGILGTVRRTTETKLPQVIAEKKAEKEEQERWDSLSVPEKIADPFKTMGANIKYGDLGIEENQAWAEYRSKQDAESLAKAQAATKAREDYETSNNRIGKGNALTKDFAQYLPQLGGQLSYGLGGAAAGAGAGALTGAGIGAATGAAAGGVGAAPGALGGATTGALWGARGGYVAGTAKYSYDVMAGNAYKTLLDMGVPNEVALELSGDEAIINSLIEGTGAVVDLVSLGIGKLASKSTLTPLQKIAQSKLASAAAAYGMNLVTEPVEEMAQEKVSIETEKKAADVSGIERQATEAQDRERIKEAGIGALKVSAIAGLGNAGGNVAVNSMSNNLNTNADTRKLSTIDSKTLNQLTEINKNIEEQKKVSEITQPEENVARGLPTNGFQGQSQQTILPTQKNQETVNSAKIAGMSDFDVKKATDLHKMLQSGSNLKFYDSKNVPAGVDSRAINANGFYKDGTLWINKDSKRQVEKILGHELTHHLENTEAYNDFANSIMDSNMFYDYITTQGYDNVAQFKENLRQRGYSDQEMDSEMVSMFVEDNLFDSQEKIDRLARENRTLAQKILNWLSDMKTRLVGTSQEKELLRIENMYRKALEQARNVDTTSTDAQYSIAGIKGAKRLRKNPAYSNIMEQYKNAKKLYKEGYDNTRLIEETGWYRDNKGNWKYEFPDEDMTLKKNIKLDDKKVYALDRMLEHDILFETYPQLRNYTVIFANIGNGNRAGIFAPAKIILLNPKYANTKATVEYELAHEIQHAIQAIEGFPGTTSKKKNGGYAYYTSLGEIEARDVSERLRMLQNERKQYMPETAKENPVHEGMERYMQNRTEAQRIQDEEYIQKQEAKEKIKESIKSFFERGIGHDQDISMDNNKNNTEAQSKTNRVLYNENNENKRLAGKEPAFSLPETDNQGRKLSKEQQEFFKDSKIRDDKDRLIEVYHRTNQDFTEFDRNKIGSTTDDGLWGSGFYFSNMDHTFYGKNLIKGYLNITNPFVVRDFKTIQEIAEYLDIVERNFRYEPDGLIRVSYDQIRQFTSHVIEKGHDGVIAEHDNGVCEYVIFEPNQIKNVDNTNPTENADIRYSINPVDIAKNPPNPQSGLDALKRAGREKVGDSQSSFMRNIHNQSIFDDTFKEMAWDDKNIRTYESISNKETMQQANDEINEQGQKWVNRFLTKNDGEMKAKDIAGGFILMNRYQQVGDYESMLEIAEKLRKAGTRQGQTIQLFSILGRMTPEGMTYYAQKVLSKAYDEILKNKTQAWADEHADEFKITEKDIDFIQRRVNQAAKLPEGRDKYVLLGEIASRIQSKIPPQPGQSLKALARNSMLLNPKTMVRNVLGNVVIAPAHIVSDFVGTGIDKAISNKTGVRTTGGFDSKSLKGAKKGFYESFDDFRRGISTRDLSGDRFEIGEGGKNFSENHTGIFATPRDALGKALNALDRVTGYLLESGDRPFYETWFINSLNNQMELNNAVKPTAEMIQIATEEALQRTWQDNNTYSNAVSGIREFLNLAKINGYGIGDMVMPFVKTPANLTKAIVDFSPLGAINALIKTSQFNKDIGKGQATAAQQRAVVKAWSQVITGTLGMAIATVLAEAGVLGGGSDEDKDVREFEQKILGIKPYSIKIGDKTYTYDWMQPLGTSAAIVADTVKSLKNSKDMEDKLNAILQGATSGASVFLDQSFVKSIRQFFEEDGMISGLLELIMNEPSKFTPQFLSQIAQIQDDTARTSYVYNNPLETAKNKIKAKIPGLRETLEPSVDVLGREVKTDNSVGNVMFNPANTAFARTTKGAEEMYRVYQATGDKAAIAQVAPYYFNVGSDKIVLTPQQRTQYQKTTGKIASDGVENLLKNNAYKSLEDVDKAEILKDLYSYGNAIAKAEASKKYLLPKEFQKIKDSGMQPEEYILMKHIASTDGQKKDEMYNALTSSGYTKSETEKFLTDYKGYKFENTTKNTLPTSSILRSKLPSLKK